MLGFLLCAVDDGRADLLVPFCAPGENTPDFISAVAALDDDDDAIELSRTTTQHNGKQ